MKHAYVVFDNDAPLFICSSETHAKSIVDSEQRRLERDLSSKANAVNLIDNHHLFYTLVPFAPATRPQGEDGKFTGRRRVQNGNT